MNRLLEDRARAAGIVLGGSVIAVPPHRRLTTAKQLLAAGHWVHADIIGGSYRGQNGVNDAEINMLMAVAGPLLDAHLIVDQLEEAIDLLPTGLGRVTLQSPEPSAAPGLVVRARRRATSVWVAVDGLPGQCVNEMGVRSADGLLLMLTPPGQPGHSADLSKLVNARTVVDSGMPLGVDGGVTHDIVGRLSSAGVQYAVVGRGLLHRPR